MGRKKKAEDSDILGQMDLFSMYTFQPDDDIYENSPFPSSGEAEKAQTKQTDTDLPSNQNDMDLAVGDVIWAFADKKIDSYIVTEAHENFCITKGNTGEFKRLTMRSRGICWDYTREAVQILCDKYYNQK